MNATVAAPLAPQGGSRAGLSDELAHRVESFELALEVDRTADFARHLPPTGHPLYLAALGELVRIDLETAWDDGRCPRLAAYTARFPVILATPALLAAVAFEEYRQRLRAGKLPQPDEYRIRYGVDVSGWEELGPGSGTFDPDADTEPAGTVRFPPDAPATDILETDVITDTDMLGQVARNRTTASSLSLLRPARTPLPPRTPAEELSQWQEAATALPNVGTEFLGFHLERELGRGAFGRVYFARQGDLAGRPVALKVARGLGGESHTLAQLQHPNIVPIYSFHNAGAFQAVCMPFLGGTTLGQVVVALGMSGVPSSGRELRSTLARGKGESTVAGSKNADPSQRPSESKPHTPAEPLPPALVPTEGSPEGWARLEGLSYVEAILAIGGQLADGLAHAHQRGILHRDLKPANVLLTDDGRPMLLDFNLAEDTKLRGSAEGATIGGTIPYMSPEQLTAFFKSGGLLDGRSDVYALGVVLFQLLTGRHPFPMRGGAPRIAVKQMLADRADPPLLRPLNPAVSPGVESIIRKCLASDLANRYQSAEELKEDIDRHLAHRPLKHAADPSFRERARKWVRRHPRLTSSGAVAAIAVATLAATAGSLLYARERARGLEARGRLADHQAAFRDAQSFLDDRTRSAARMDDGLEKLKEVLRGYGVPEDEESSDGWQSAATLRYLSDADRERVRGDIGETFFLAAQVSLLKASATSDLNERLTGIGTATKWNKMAERYGTERLPRALREQRGRLSELLGDKGAADRLREEAGRLPPVSARDFYLAGSQYARDGKHSDAVRQLQQATRLDPENFSAWFLRGVSHLALEQDDLAVMCFGACVSLRPDFSSAWRNRGFAFFRLRYFDHAREDYDQAIRLDPAVVDALIQRGELREATGDLDGALADFTRALDTGEATARAYFKRATAKFLKGDHDGAKADREAGFKTLATDEMSWIARAENRLPDDPKAALADVDEALKVNPWSVTGLQLKAAILSEFLKRHDDALCVLDKAVELHPEHVPTLAGRGVQLARAGKREAALRDAAEALRRDIRPPNLYQVGCIHALLVSKDHPEHAREAVHLLWGGLKAGFALDLVDTDADLNPLRNDEKFKAMVKDAKALEALRQVKK